jgi:tetratricopeptide (TPR) repeat protein
MKMLKNIFNLKSRYYIILLLGLLMFTFYESKRMIRVAEINQKLMQDELIIDDSYEELTLYSSAYQLGKQGEYDNAIEKFTRLLKRFPETERIDVIYYNIGTLYLKDALTKPLNDDGKVTAENFQKLQSAIISLEKALAINPKNTKAKFNLSLLLSSIPSEASKIITEQSVQELSNIPIGLP